LQLRPALFVPDQAIKDGKHLFAIRVDALQRFSERLFEVSCFQPLI